MLLHGTHFLLLLFTQDVLSGSGARLAAIQAATLQRCLAANPASVQLLSRGIGVTSQTTPSPVAAAGPQRSSGRALAAMLRVASAEAPAAAFSFLEVSAASAAAWPPADSSLPISPAADAHGQSLSAGAWMAPHLSERRHVAAGGNAAGSAGSSSVSSAGRILVTGARGVWMKELLELALAYCHSVHCLLACTSFAL